MLAKRNQDHFDNLDKLIFIISAVMIYYSTVVRTTDHLISNIYYKEYFSGTHLIKKNSTLMSIRVVGPMPDSDGYSTFHKLLQGGSYFMALNSVVDVKHVQAHSAMVPVRFKDEMDSYKHWFTDSELVSSIPQMSLPGLETFSNKKLDYLLVWGPLKDALKIKGYGKIVHQLLQKIEKNFNLIHISRPYGYLHLYEHK
ncbi:MAG: hypothetical protein ISR65_16940 [Bacteriovoracaceae bacterium]|nr:hypothetical protein [Bacteriovoracaceae bacterium]